MPATSGSHPDETVAENRRRCGSPQACSGEERQPGHGAARLASRLPPQRDRFGMTVTADDQ